MPGPCGHLLYPACGCPAPTALALTPEAELLQRFDAWSSTVGSTRLDSWSNVVTGIGTRQHDKREHAHLRSVSLGYEDAIQLWRQDAMAARIIELLPSECFAKGYDLAIVEGGYDQDFLNDTSDRMEELEVDRIIEEAYKYERAYGGSAILMGIDDGGAIDEPLIPTKARSLDWLTLMEPLEIYPASYYQDPSHPKYGQPEYYRQQAFTVSGAGTVIGVTDRRAPTPTEMLIHESRLIIFGGIRVSRYQRNDTLMGPLWGDSILIRVLEALRDYNIAWASAGLLTTDFSQSVISIENLMALVAKHPDKLRDRMRATTLMASNARAVLIDSKEKYQRESTNLSGLPEVMDRLSQRLAADGDIPLSMLMNVSPSSLGQPGQNDVAMFQDRVRSAQRRRLTPPVKFLAGIVMQTLRKRKLPKRWGVEWRNLVHQSDKDITETRLAQARTDTMNVKMGALKPDEVRESRWRTRYSFDTHIDKGKAPGFLAPLPAGVLPKAMSAEQAITAKEAGNKPGAAPVAGNPATAKQPLGGPSGHIVGGYARRNPVKSGTGDAPSENDVTPKKSRRDALDADGGGERRTFAGLPVVVESPRGSTRNWTDTDGTQGSTVMNYDYGYVPGVNGADGDSSDVYLGPNENASHVYIVHQMKKPDFAQFDEDKSMIGWNSASDAHAAYLKQYDNPKFFGGMTPMTMEQYRTNYLGAGLAENKSSTGGENQDAKHLNNGTAVKLETSTPDDRAQLEKLFEGQESPTDEHSDYIEKVGSSFHVMGEKGESLGHYATKAEAVTRLRQIEYFKAHPNKDARPTQPQGGKEAITGGWSEQENNYQVLTMPEKKPEPSDDPLWNASLHTMKEDE